MYAALAKRASGLAELTDQSPVLAQLVRSFAMGVARWAQKMGNSVSSVHVEPRGKGEFFAIRVSARGGLILRQTTVIKTTYANAFEFLNSNPYAIDACNALVKWAAHEIDHGATSFEARWSPASDGFLAFRARYPQPALAPVLAS